MARSMILPLVAAAALAGGAALSGAQAQTTTVTTQTKTMGGVTSKTTTVTTETSVTGAPDSGSATSGSAAAGGDLETRTGAEAASQMSSNDKVMTKDGIRYVCTGVGEESRTDPRWKDFAAKLVFTVKGGGYLPDVQTDIKNGKGQQVFSMKCDAPWLLVDLPAARYKVVATAEDPQGKTHERTADISVAAKGQREAIIRFDDIPG